MLVKTIFEGNFYVYFGIVPVILLFLPFRLITGMHLSTYCATQIFVSFAIIGFFCFFYELRKKFFHKMSLQLYLTLSVGLSAISVWYATWAPALYCTAISAGICMMIWSVYFYFKAVYVYTEENMQIKTSAWGALFGALCFGCRPTIALANIAILPMLILFLQEHKINVKSM